jgi:uncharacterized protein YecT (DUF1311 family)
VALTLVGLFFLSIVSSGASGAIPTSTTAPGSYDSSCEKTAQSQIQLDQCAQSELKQVQTQLTTLLTEDSAQFGKRTVNKVQGRWRQFRDAECDLEAKPYRHGTIVPLIIGECEIQLTVQRTQSLSAYLRSRPH